jgi:hypothetical protein
LFDLFGHSPLVEFYLYNQKARKINKPEILIQHPSITEFPPVHSKTYEQVIKESLKRIKKLEKEIKQ